MFTFHLIKCIIVSLLVSSAAFVPIAPKTLSSKISVTYSPKPSSSSLVLVIQKISHATRSTALYMDAPSSDLIASAITTFTANAGLVFLLLQIKKELKDDNKDLKKDNETLKTEFKKDNETLKTEIKADIDTLKKDNESLKAEIKKDNETLKTEIKTDIDALKKDNEMLKTVIKNDNELLKLDVKDQLKEMKVELKNDIKILKEEVEKQMSDAKLEFRGYLALFITGKSASTHNETKKNE